MRRKDFAVAGLSASAGLAVVRYPGDAAEFTYKIGSGETATHPKSVAVRGALDKILQGSGGRLEIKQFPNNQLGSDSSMLLQIRQGALEFELVTNSNLAQVVPVV